MRLNVLESLGAETYLDPKVNVVSRFGRGPVYPKSVGSRGFFEIDPTPPQNDVSH